MSNDKKTNEKMRAAIMAHHDSINGGILTRNAKIIELLKNGPQSPLMPVVHYRWCPANTSEQLRLQPKNWTYGAIKPENSHQFIIEALVSSPDAYKIIKPMSAKLDKAKQELKEAHEETLEQARLNGMGGEREWSLMGKIERLEKELAIAKSKATTIVDKA